MATTQTSNLQLTLQDDNEFISIEKTAENFEKIDAAFGADRAAISELNGGTITQAATLSNVATADNKDTRWGKVKKAIAVLISHLGAGGSAHSAATTGTAGFMSAADKAKLDGIQAGATNTTQGTTYTHPNYLGSSKASGLYKLALNSSGHVTSAAAVTAAEIRTLIDAPVVKKGNVTFTGSGNRLYSEVNVTYQGFSSAPVVTAIFNSPDGNGFDYPISVLNITTSGCKFRVQHGYGDDPTLRIGWIAVGT